MLVQRLATVMLEETMSKETCEDNFNRLPVGPLGIIPLPGCEDLCRKVDEYLVQWRHESKNEYKKTAVFAGYERDTFIIDTSVPRFGSGEAKGMIQSSVRGDDIYLLVDVCNNSLTYQMHDKVNHMSPDDHFQNTKRLVAAISGKARRITVIMPFLYESRQLTRKGRESLDCAHALKELVDMGVSHIVTFDAHDPRVQNAIPLTGFDNVMPTYQFIKNLLRVDKELTIDAEHMTIVSTDEGAMERAVYYANVMGLDVGMFYKRRDYTKLVQGVNPVLKYEFLGASVEGKTVLIVDDMISSGDSILSVARELKKYKAKKIIGCVTFGLFTGGLEKFDKAFEEGIIDRLLTTNLVYQPQELLQRSYYTSVDLSKYIALLVDSFNHDSSIQELLNPIDRIQRVLKEYRG